MTKQYNDELKRAPAGKKYIYVITETETGKMYIGQTRNFHKRMCSHRNCGYSQHSAIDRVIQEKGVDAEKFIIIIRKHFLKSQNTVYIQFQFEQNTHTAREIVMRRTTKEKSTKI